MAGSTDTSFARNRSANKIDWHGRLLVAIAAIPLLCIALLFATSTFLLICTISVIAAAEYAALRNNILKSFIEEGNQTSSVYSHLNLQLLSVAFLTSCYLDQHPIAESTLIATTFISFLCICLTSIVPFLWLRCDDGSASVLVRAVLLKGALDLYFFFHFVWSLGFGIYTRKLPQALGLATLSLACSFTGDTGALIFGNYFGKLKFMPVISPRKSYAGIFGSFICSFIAALALYHLSFKFGIFSLGQFSTFKDYTILSMIIPLTGGFGDIMESALKRASQVKDSSGLFGAHGGMLDRLDSLSISLPLVYFYAVGMKAK